MNILFQNTENYELIKNKYKISDLCAKVLASKQLEDDEIESLLFSNERMRDLDLSFLTPVVEKIQNAKIKKEKILICGDYDCDGICATTILYDALKSYGISCGFYIPNRFNEGYGLHENTVQLASEKGYHILITVDNGVKATRALKLAKEKGIYVILSDHHSYEPEDLVYDDFVHPNIMEEKFHGLCGAGVSLLIARALIGNNDMHTMLACIATIGDVVPLRNVNRILVKEGIQLLNTKPFPQITKIANDNKKWDAKKIAFQIVPKLNSVGRLADIANANNVVRYLCSHDPIVIDDMAKQINHLNETRKQISANMSNKALLLVSDAHFQIIEDENFHEGMNGIVASKLCSSLRKPVMVLSHQDGILKGSIRSNTIDLRTFFDDIKEELLSYGGHKEAAGIAFSYDKLDFVKKYVSNKLKNEDWEDMVEVLPVHKNEINEVSLQSLDILEPFGCGFESPTFYIEDTIVEKQGLSKNQHLKMKSDSFSYLYFNHGYELENYKIHTKYGFIGKFEISEFYRHKSINLMVDYIQDMFE